jgi:integrase
MGTRIVRTNDVIKFLRIGGRHRYAAGNSLFLRVKGGSAIWEYVYRDGARTRTMTLGSAVGPNAVSLMDARAARAAAWTDRRAKAPPRRRKPTSNPLFGEAAQKYLADHKVEWSLRQNQRHATLLRLYTASLSKRPVQRIEREEIKAVLEPIWTGPNHGRGAKLRALLDQILNAAEVPQPGPAAWARLSNIMSRESRKPKPHPALPWEQVPEVMAELISDSSRQANAIRFVILTAVRQQEALGATWQEIDLDKKLWTIPAARMKADKMHVVPLSDEAIACIGAPGSGRVVAAHGYVFPSVRRPDVALGSTLVNIRIHRLNRGITLHGFRSTFTDWAAENGYPSEHREMALAHTVGDKVEQAYRRTTLIEMRRQMMDAWADFACSAVDY